MADPVGPVSAHRHGAAVTGVLLAVLLASVVLLIATGSSRASAASPATQPLEVAGPVRLVVPDGGLIGVAGTRYHDTIELTTSGRAINELEVERYLEGVAEMPSRWPAEALKAQAVAARTYLWWSADRGVHDGYDICATTACQVFRGAEVALDGGERWVEAVAATSGEVLLEPDGGPILARYFSTSGGRTYANEDVFPSTGPRDYLVAIDDPADAVSPYHRWEVRFTRAEFDEILSRGERLAATVPVTSVERTGPVDDVSAGFVVAGGGAEVEVGAVELRDFLSQVAPSRFPDRFPTTRSDGLRPLPSTVPSSRFTVAVGDDEVVLSGRGWGHGVGLGQYGARGRAGDGEDHRDILAAYYGGLRPEVSPELPERVRVGLGVDERFELNLDGAVSIEDADGEVLATPALGPWTAERTAAGWRLSPPDDADRELEVAPTRAVEHLERPGEAVTVETEVNKHTLLRLEVVDADGQPVRRRDLGVAAPGTHAATWRLDDDDARTVAAGTYAVTLIAEDAAGQVAGEPAAVEVSPDARAGTEAEDDRAGPALPTLDGSGTLATWAAIGLVVGGALVLFLLVRRTIRRQAP